MISDYIPAFLIVDKWLSKNSSVYSFGYYATHFLENNICGKTKRLAYIILNVMII